MGVNLDDADLLLNSESPFDSDGSNLLARDGDEDVDGVLGGESDSDSLGFQPFSSLSLNDENEAVEVVPDFCFSSDSVGFSSSLECDDDSSGFGVNSGLNLGDELGGLGSEADFELPDEFLKFDIPVVLMLA